ncbi:MAG: hypothetical protein BWY72_01946 [Bacteroidetes bacterium ADurb.Bin416]|nr:MAG: hypothetical protein BWY72_01946 [Bacteroidetes bacterium ADurb.Bin416]
MENSTGAIVVVFLDRIIVEVFTHVFTIPTKETETIVWLHLIEDNGPIVVVPIGVATIKIEEHVIGQIDHIDQRRVSRIAATIRVVTPQPLVGSIVLEPGIGHGHDLFPGLVGTIHSTAGVVFYNIKIRLCTVEIRLGIILVETLGQRVKSPIQSINV